MQLGGVLLYAADVRRVEGGQIDEASHPGDPIRGRSRPSLSGGPLIGITRLVRFSSEMHRTLVIIPALNEEEALPRVLQSLTEAIPSSDVLVVDDGSTDSTASVARRGGARVASLPINLGIGAALRVGFRFASEQGYDRAIQFDADGQHDASEIRHLVRALDEGSDIVIGSRFTEGSGDYSVSVTRGLAMSLLRVVIRAITRTKLTDTSSGFRGFSAPVIELFARSYPREYMDSVEALVIAARNGYEICEVPVQMHERMGGVPSNRRFRLAYNYIRVITGLLLTVSRRRPSGRAA